MQTDETRAREVLAATVPLSISSAWTAEEERQIIRAMMAFQSEARAVPPDGERVEDFGGPMPWEGPQPIEKHAKIWRGRDWVPLDAAISQLQFWQKRDWQHSNARPLPTLPHQADREAIARAIHVARFRRPTVWPWEEEDRDGKDYCYRLADAILALSPTPSAGRDGGGARITPEWCMKMAHLEEGMEVGAGLMAMDPGLCDDCPPIGYPTDKTRCRPCPRRATLPPATEKAEK